MQVIGNEIVGGVSASKGAERTSLIAGDSRSPGYPKFCLIAQLEVSAIPESSVALNSEIE